jgi:ATPase subunit of ABC transporter with duplicated ATPase domains
MTQIDAYTAEARAATILHGLGFTEGQIHGTTGSLSGGWRMRVAIAGALFIQPEVQRSRLQSYISYKFDILALFGVLIKALLLLLDSWCRR